MNRTRVLYVASTARSGSTLLGNLLGQLQGFVHIGELRLIWKHGINEHRSCGCGKAVLNCEFWTEVCQEAFGGWDGIDVGAYERAHNRMYRHRRSPWMLFGPTRDRALEANPEYRTSLSKLYTATAQISNARVVVDTSSTGAYGYVLRQLPDLDVRVVHLIRDPRGVAYSSSQLKDNPASGKPMGGISPLRSAVDWNMANLTAQRLLETTGPYLRLGYEELIANPTETIAKILRLVDEDPAAVSALPLKEDTVELRPTHTMSGNPGQYRRGPVVLRADHRWKVGLAEHQQRLVSLTTWPLRRRYRDLDV